MLFQEKNLRIVVALFDMKFLADFMCQVSPLQLSATIFTKKKKSFCYSKFNSLQSIQLHVLGIVSKITCCLVEKSDPPKFLQTCAL